MIKVSVIVPVYNSEKYLSECLNSLVNQTLDELEIICVDDGSTDKSLEILRDYEKKYSNLTVIQNSQNQGQSIARNIGMKHAKGEYIAFLDSDDYVHLDMYKIMYESAIKHDYPGVVSCSVRFVKDDTYDQDVKSEVNSFAHEIDLLKNPEAILWSSPSVCNKIFLRDLFSDLHFLENAMFEDIAFSYSALMKSGRILNINALHYFYRRDLTNGVSATVNGPTRKILDIFKVADFLESYAKKNRFFDKFEPQIRFIQASSILQRINEVNNWQVECKDKTKLMKGMYTLTKERYIDPETLDKGYLSSKVDIEIINKMHF